jgi:hypothetical protein
LSFDRNPPQGSVGSGGSAGFPSLLLILAFQEWLFRWIICVVLILLLLQQGVRGEEFFPSWGTER